MSSCSLLSPLIGNHRLLVLLVIACLTDMSITLPMKSYSFLRIKYDHDFSLSLSTTPRIGLRDELIPRSVYGRNLKLPFARCVLVPTKLINTWKSRPEDETVRLRWNSPRNQSIPRRFLPMPDVSRVTVAACIVGQAVEMILVLEGKYSNTHVEMSHSPAIEK